MFDPMILPTAMSGTPRQAASTETRSSGVEVPNPTTVRPISKGGMAMLRAIPTLPRTKASPPRNKPIKLAAT